MTRTLRFLWAWTVLVAWAFGVFAGVVGWIDARDMAQRHKAADRRKTEFMTSFITSPYGTVEPKIVVFGLDGIFYDMPERNFPEAEKLGFRLATQHELDSLNATTGWWDMDYNVQFVICFVGLLVSIPLAMTLYRGGIWLVTTVWRYSA